MGIYDRDYYRDERSGFQLSDQPMVINLIIANVAFYLVNLFTENNWLTRQMMVQADDLWHPWMWWHFLTAGFAHDPDRFSHILFNMIALFIFGRGVEEVYGRWEFLKFYLVAVVTASIVWCVCELAMGGDPNTSMLGASGAVTAVLILFAFNFRNATILLFFVLPMPAWVLAVLFVSYDLLSAIFQPQGGAYGSQVAYTAHLAGAAFGAAYYQWSWNITRWTSHLTSAPWLRRKPRLKVHDPPDREERPLQDRVDAILDKINREGEASLTREERSTLEEASRRYQRRRQ